MRRIADQVGEERLAVVRPVVQPTRVGGGILHQARRLPHDALLHPPRRDQHDDVQRRQHDERGDHDPHGGSPSSSGDAQPLNGGERNACRPSDFQAGLPAKGRGIDRSSFTCDAAARVLARLATRAPSVIQCPSWGVASRCQSAASLNERPPNAKRIVAIIGDAILRFTQSQAAGANLQHCRARIMDRDPHHTYDPPSCN
jgi:hypothetical protein